ncbi:hypothetical protein BBP40_008932 [Aspergillus hancockii]|nr:hypothetical protein BBP40_008932 [Aspergillus hancockii]
MVWNIPKFLAALAVGSLFSPAFANPTGDINPWKDDSIRSDFGDEIRSYGTQPSYVKREITGLFSGLSEQPDLEANAGYSAIPKRVLQLNIDKPNDNGEVSDVGREGLATAFEAIDLVVAFPTTSCSCSLKKSIFLHHNQKHPTLVSDKPSIVSRGEKEEKELSDFKHVWKGETFYRFIAAKDMDLKNRAHFDPNEIKALAQKGYELIKDKFRLNGNVIVSALFIPDVGVAVGSKPRGTGIEDELLDKTHKVSGKYKHVSNWFDRYWNLVEPRQNLGVCDHNTKEDVLYAEDLVIIKGAEEYLKKQKVDYWNQKKFPLGTHIVSYGKYNSKPGSSSVVGPKEPCGGTEKTQLTIPCKNVLHGLRIDWST